MHLLDTNVAIHLRDGERTIARRVAALPHVPVLSMMTWVELEGGIHRQPTIVDLRRKAVDALLDTFEILPLEPEIVRAYAAIVEAAGFSRRRVIDRLIAATAIVHDLTLVTINPADFRDIPGLSLESWPAPGQ